MQRVHVKLGGAVGRGWSYMPSANKTMPIIIDDGEDAHAWGKGHADYLGLEFKGIEKVEQGVNE